MIPVNDLSAINGRFATPINAAIRRVVKSGRFILGEEVECFERELADYCGVKFAVGVGNGTDAISIALEAAGMPKGAKIATVGNSAPATTTAIVRAGGIPVFAEIGDDGLIDPVGLFDLPPVWGVVPVHLYGNPCDIGKIQFWLDHRGRLPVIYDACQAIGTTWGGKPVTSFGLASAVSFYPTKNLGAFGDGGAILMNDPNIAEVARQIRNYGFVLRDQPARLGRNSRLDEIQAAILRVKLTSIDAVNADRRRMAALYTAAIPARFRIPRDPGSNGHLYAVRVPNRDALRKRLADAGILTAVHYPVPAWEYAGGTGTGKACPSTARWCRETLTLPLFFGMPTETACIAGRVLRRSTAPSRA